MISRINRAARRQEGFTLIELLVVIGIIGILAMLLLPQFRGMRDRARLASCQSNLKNIGTQLEAEYVDKDSYPKGGTATGSGSWAGLTTGSGALVNLSKCPGDSSSYTYKANPDYSSVGGSLPSSGVVDFANINETNPTSTVTSYVVFCGYHNGKGASFPQTVQLFVTQDGVQRREGTGGGASPSPSPSPT